MSVRDIFGAQKYNPASSDYALRTYRATVTLTDTQVKAMFSSPTTIVTAVSGYYIVPVWAWFEKSAGTAYTIGTATKLGLYLGSQIFISAWTMPGFMDSASAISRFSRGPGTNLTELIGQAMFASVDGVDGVALKVQNSVADLTVGTATLKVTVLYHLVPVNS